ncbi:hypothetical protein HMPREF0682_0787 [Propionibacterium acidifaciens F0233]|uniref:Uncharacterized protein n=1 Tax=Propionibacterium acidifaciens F0233 TaxID=553198 RepID=U2RLX9_9ACTN|nr:hypothetical protein HMPREF0682_0787 [Propionibacterium acidifaciens F0233]
MPGLARCHRSSSLLTPPTLRRDGIPASGRRGRPTVPPFLGRPGGAPSRLLAAAGSSEQAPLPFFRRLRSDGSLDACDPEHCRRVRAEPHPAAADRPFAAFRRARGAHPGPVGIETPGAGSGAPEAAQHMRPEPEGPAAWRTSRRTEGRMPQRPTSPRHGTGARGPIEGPARALDAGARGPSLVPAPGHAHGAPPAPLRTHPVNKIDFLTRHDMNFRARLIS